MRTLFIIDNGHGNDTPGKCSPDKTILEWQWTREIALKIAKRCLDEGIDYQLLTPEFEDISLSERVAREKEISAVAKQKGYRTALISIHINAAGNSGWCSACGWTGWVAKNASSKSKSFAHILYEEAEKRELKGNRCVPACKYWEADYYILKNTSCPAVLTENLFQDNKDDVEILKSEEGKQKIVELHIAAMKRYIEEV